MKAFRYLPGVTTLEYDEDRCVGCGSCETVCPHGVFNIKRKKACMVDKDGCMECGACALNCPTAAIRVTPGVGCAAYIISGWIHGKENASCGGQGSGKGSCC
jgi:NAD-dependent dihydropyrimidine dehydrogenase PreA subunit